MLVEALKILAPVRIIHSKRDVIQTFYMKFAKDLYRWDLAQYFTPTTLTAFIVDALAPQFGEHVFDPACGSADFLIAAFHKGREFDTSYADCVWGADNSVKAVQIAVLNMLLNGDGKGNIAHEDSLEQIEKRARHYDVVVCNPPFGTKIVETRADVLAKFDLGHEWSDCAGVVERTETISGSQESGILFLEACVRLARAGGRVGIILPNGYLGNRSMRYKALRHWMLCHCRVACICSLPRFTFKTSGADVSASVVFLEKRNEGLEAIPEHEDYMFSVEIVEKVGWEAGNKRAKPVYRRDPEDGSFIIDAAGDPIVDSDFPDKLARIGNSDGADCFAWLARGHTASDTPVGWAVDIDNVLRDSDLTLDPKRWCEKVSTVRDMIRRADSFTLGEALDFLPERKSTSGKPFRVQTARTYKYVELQNIGYGDYRYEEVKGWELPSRARHLAEPGDLFLGAIWGSVQKWCLIGNTATDLVVTNGCHRCRLKAGREDDLVDLVAFFNTEAYAVQMRSFSRGSDGLAEVTQHDAANVLVPRISDDEARLTVKEQVNRLMDGLTSVRSVVTQLLSRRLWDFPDVDKRPSHIVLV